MKYSTLLKKTLVGCVYIGVFAFAPITFHSDDGSFSYHAAYAKGGNGGGNSGGNGGGHGGGNSGGNSNGNSSGKSSGSASVSASANSSLSTKSNGNAYGHSKSGLGATKGEFASALGRLNAAHASENARAHASANSVVGALAQYKAAALTTLGYTNDVNTWTATVQNLEEAVAANPDDTELAAQLASAQDSLAEAEALRDNAAQVEADTLATAANKEVTDEVTVATRNLLGIPTDQ